MNPFVKKGYGRIYSLSGNVQFVLDAIKAIDEYEFSYLPSNVVAAWKADEPVELVYTHKFEICIDALTEYCWKHGEPVWCISQHNEYWNGYQPKEEPV